MKTPKMWATLCIGLLFSTLVPSDAASWHKGMQPGMIGRINQGAVDDVKQFLESNYAYSKLWIDANFPTSYTYTFDSIPLVKFSLGYSDFKYDVLNLDMSDVRMDMLKTKGQGNVFFDFPAVKEWSIEAQEHINFLWETTGHFKLDIVNFDIDFECYLRLDENGYLDPVVEQIKIDYGQSQMHHDNFVLEFLYHQMILLSFKALEVTAPLLGRFMFTELLGPVIDFYLNGYQFVHRQHSLIPGQEDIFDVFQIDLRNTKDPTIFAGMMDLSFFGQTLLNGRECPNYEPEELNMEFKNITQLVISESALECLAYQAAESKLGQIYLTDDRMKKFLDDERSIITAKTVSKYLPVFSSLLDDLDTPLEFELRVKRPEIKLKDDYDRPDMEAEFDLEIKAFDVTNKGSPNLLFSDVLGIKGSGNPKIVLDSRPTPPIHYLAGYISELKLNINMKFGQAMLPKENRVGMSENQYNSLLNQMAIFLGTLKKYLNDVTLKRGLDLKFNVGNLYLGLDFKKNHMFLYMHSDEDV